MRDHQNSAQRLRRAFAMQQWFHRLGDLQPQRPEARKRYRWAEQNVRALLAALDPRQEVV